MSFSLFLDAPPPLDPRCPLDNDMSLSTYSTTYVKGGLGLRGGGGKQIVEAKKKEIKHLTEID